MAAALRLDFAVLRQHTLYMLNVRPAVQIILRSIPEVQAVYLYGSANNPAVPPEAVGDVDIALLLPPGSELDRARLMLSELRTDLEDEFGRPADLASLRGAAVTFVIEVLRTGERIFTADTFAADTFEMLSLSAYQRLNEQRAGILADMLASGRAVHV